VRESISQLAGRCCLKLRNPFPRIYDAVSLSVYREHILLNSGDISLCIATLYENFGKIFVTLLIFETIFSTHFLNFNNHYLIIASLPSIPYRMLLTDTMKILRNNFFFKLSVII